METHCQTCQEEVRVKGDGTCSQCGEPLMEPWSEDPDEE